MRRSQLFTKTMKNAPADETSLNAQLLIRAGYIHKEMAGVYAYLPLGLKVIDNIKQIVRQEMEAIGALEIIMTNLQRQELWEKTDRWDDDKVDIWFKSQLKNGNPIGLAWSHEEPITDMMRNYIASYRDLPANVYQFQTKLRNELRAKSGIMRGREFVMKDLYSYSRDEVEHQKFYDSVTAAYLKVFDRVGIGDKTFVTYASGGSFTQFSHEFQTVTDAGEDIIYLDRTSKLAVNKEVFTDEVISQLGLDKSAMEELKASEVGNIFSFGTAKSDQLGLNFTDQDGKEKGVVLGSYGIGITRLMGVITELFADSKGLVWPDAIAPAAVYLIRIGDSQPVTAEADELYNLLTASGIGVIYDDRNARPGDMFADADLLGIPNRVVISEKTLANEKYEWKQRTSEKAEQISREKLLNMLGFRK
ncbi:MAG TPA: aminoacyl--tRNA ligase-related protein [Candidatus Saccharimonadales bacterium]|nr:aminoacyl--tRNA ligase-related protein [Candidatus Saccharimonadales bacterium]